MTMAGITPKIAGSDETHLAALPQDDLIRILDALLSNATKYAGVPVRTSRSVTDRSNMVAIFVSDTGPGVPAEELPNIVDRFYRAASAPGTGTGLGLSIVHALTERAGGSLQVSGRRPSGLRIELQLPRTDALS